MTGTLTLLPISETGFSAWRSILDRSGFLGPLLWEHVNRRSGRLFALAPPESLMSRLDTPERGGLIGASDETPESALVALLLRGQEQAPERRTVFLEEAGRGPDDPFLSTIPLGRVDSATSVIFWDEIEAPRSAAATDRLLAAFRDIGPFPVVCGFAGPIEVKALNATTLGVDRLVGRADVVFSNAYDFESYLIWLPDRSGS